MCARTQEMDVVFPRVRMRGSPLRISGVAEQKQSYYISYSTGSRVSSARARRGKAGSCQSEKKRKRAKANVVIPHPTRVIGIGCVRGKSPGTATTTHPIKARSSAMSREAFACLACAVVD